MTAQIGDRFTYKKEGYSVVAISNPIGFNPMNYGIKTMAVSSACWAGYWCVYDITEDGIFLKNLYINSLNGEYPDINGVAVYQSDNQEFEYMGHHIYKNLNLKMNYTGNILVGKDFIYEHYIHMGYQRPWAYKILKEFVFEEGELIKVNDCSEMAKELRIEIEHKELQKKPFTDIFEFIRNSFSLEYKDKAWWI